MRLHLLCWELVLAWWLSLGSSTSWLFRAWWQISTSSHWNAGQVDVCLVFDQLSGFLSSDLRSAAMENLCIRALESNSPFKVPSDWVGKFFDSWATVGFNIWQRCWSRKPKKRRKELSKLTVSSRSVINQCCVRPLAQMKLVLRNGFKYNQIWPVPALDHTPLLPEFSRGFLLAAELVAQNQAGGNFHVLWPSTGEE